MKPPIIRRRPSSAGYTLIEILAAAGLIAGAVAAASSLTMTMTTQEELTRGQSAAIRYGESIARLWQLGVNPSAVLLSQRQGLLNSNGVASMTFTINEGTPSDLGDDGGIAEGTVETATVSVTWQPYGSAAESTLSFDVIRPVAPHR
jgi:type II secretory pathway pseudopilin PulG